MDEQFGVLQTLRYNTSDVMSCDFGGHYQLAIGSSDKTVRVLEWKQGLGFIDVSYSPLPSHKYGVTWVRFSPQGTMLASSSVDGTTVLWNVKTGTKINTMVQATRCSVRRCEFTPDSTKLVTAGDDGVFCFWDLVHRKHIKNHWLHDDEDSCVQGLSISPDSEYMITGDTSGLLKLWPIGDVNSDQLQCLFFIKNVHDGVSCCEFSPNRDITGTTVLKNIYKVATCGADNVIKLWDVIVERGSKNEGESEVVSCDMVVIRTFEGHLSDVHNVRFNANGLWLASTGLDKTVKLWQVKNGECLQTFTGHTRYGNCCAFSKDSTLLASGSNDRTVIVWDLKQNLTLDAQLIKPCSASCHFTHNPVCSLAEQMVVHQAEADANRMELLQTLNLQAAVNSVHFFGNNLLATAGGDKVVSLWQRKDDEITFSLYNTLEDHRYSINQLEVSPCGTKIISCSMDGVIIFWDLEIGLTHEMRTPDCTNSLRTSRFSLNSELIAAAGDDQIVFLWDAKSLEFIKTLQDHKDAITSVAFSPDSKLLASTCCAGDIKIYNLETDECSITESDAHDLGAMSCDFSFQNLPKTTSFDEDGDQDYLLATCGNDSLVKVWQVQNTEIIKHLELSNHGGNVNYVRFSPNVPYLLVSCATDNTARIWNVKSGQCLHVLEHHESMVTTCCFSEDSSLLATGSLDKRVILWSLPEQLNADPEMTLQSCRKILQNWTTEDIAEWFEDQGYSEIANKVRFTTLNGRQILGLKENSILEIIGLENEEEREAISLRLYWLKKEAKRNSWPVNLSEENVPHQFLCPITHEIMTDPVICSDGFTYERGAITEWLLSGRFTSPMTNEQLRDTKFLPNTTLKNSICKFLYGEEISD